MLFDHQDNLLANIPTDIDKSIALLSPAGLRPARRQENGSPIRPNPLVGVRLDAHGRVVAEIELAAQAGGLAGCDEAVSPGERKAIIVEVVQHLDLCVHGGFSPFRAVEVGELVLEVRLLVDVRQVSERAFEARVIAPEPENPRHDAAQVGLLVGRWQRH